MNKVSSLSPAVCVLIRSLATAADILEKHGGAWIPGLPQHGHGVFPHLCVAMRFGGLNQKRNSFAVRKRPQYGHGIAAHLPLRIAVDRNADGGNGLGAALAPKRPERFASHRR